MARYEKFLPRVMLGIGECPEPVAIDAIRAACIEFCEQTRWVTYEPEPMPIAVGADTYPLDVPLDTVPVVVVDAWAAGVRMTPTSPEQIAASGVDWRQQQGMPTKYLQFSPDALIVSPVPTERVEDGLKVLIATKPSQDSVDVEDSVYEHHYDAVVQGALARLYAQPNRPYSNAQLAMLARSSFNSMIAVASAKRQRGLTRGPMKVQMRKWV